MKEETTSRLEEAIQKIKSKEDAERFFDDHGVEQRFFYQYLNQFIADNNLVVSDIIEKSGISKNYVYNILNGNTKQPGRDKIIAISIASGMNYTEVNRALKISGHNELYPKNKRDIHITSCLNRGITNILIINIELSEMGLEPIVV